MRKIQFCLLLIALILSSCTPKNYSTIIASHSEKRIEQDLYPEAEIKLKNKSNSDLKISVVDGINGKTLRGFGLAPQAQAEILVEDHSVLKIANFTESDVGLKYSVKEFGSQNISSEIRQISFTLRNDSNESIPLIIPNVMNPNLSPNSDSGVSLIIGQKIIYKLKGKKIVLLTVSDDIKNGDVIEVNKLIAEL